MYSSVEDMILMWGEVEMIRLSSPTGQDDGFIVRERIERALADADVQIDTYVARRYRTPLAVVPDVIARHSRILARYDLMTGDGREPSEQAKDMRKETIAWLRDLSKGEVLLEAEEVPSSDESYAQVQIGRRATYGG